jgi:hypothetical protein
MATPERVEITAARQQEETPPADREAPAAPGENLVATIQPRSLPQPPMLLNLGIVEIFASLGMPSRKAA